MAEGDRTEGIRPARDDGSVPRALRPSLAAQRRLMEEARAEELQLPYRREELMVEAADRIQALTTERRLDGFAGNALDREAGSLIVYWKGPLPQEMDELVDELRREIAIDVRDAPYSREELLRESRRISGLDLPGLRITGVEPLGDCSGLRVTLDEGNDLTRASREIKSPMRLEFGVRRPPRIMPIGRLTTPPSAHRLPYLSAASPDPDGSPDN